MSPSPPRFTKLIDLAQAPSSDKRRELLREVTDLFFETAESRSAREEQLFDEVLRAVASTMSESVLKELAERFADAENPPTALMRDLAEQTIPVAELVLRRCRSLTEEDLLRVVAEKSQAHVRAVAQRESVSETLSAAIVEKGDDSTVDVLMRNRGAKISRETLEVVVDRAQHSRALHEAVVLRPDLPLDLLNEMYFIVEQQLRTQILTRNAAVDPATLEKALSQARKRTEQDFAALSEESKQAQAFIAKKKAAGELTPPFLVHLYREKRMAEFIHGLAELTGVEVELAHGLVGRGDLDALATICRAANLERPLFVTLAVLIGGQEGMGKAEEYGKAYAAVPVEAAQRAMRFFSVRKTAQAPRPGV